MRKTPWRSSDTFGIRVYNILYINCSEMGGLVLSKLRPRARQKQETCKQESQEKEERGSMSMKLRASSGTYNVRASELARDKTIKTVKCVVHFLDDTEATFEIDKRGKAQHLLDKVFDHLELVEKDYFGLQFADVAPAPDAMEPSCGFFTEQHSALQPSPCDLMRWLDPLKTLKKQIRVGPPYLLYFRVKFYVTDPSKLQEEYTRYHFFLQMKKDILEGRLVVPYKTAVILSSYAVQSELGDFNPEEHTVGYLSEFRFVPVQSEEFEREVADQHKCHRGLSPADAEAAFLAQTTMLEMYGLDLYQASWVRFTAGPLTPDTDQPDLPPSCQARDDQSNLEIQLGVTSAGLVVFQSNVRVNTFSWAKIVKISFKRKQFFIQLRRELNSRTVPSNRTPNMNDNVENLIGFNMVSYRSCKNLWKSCVEHHTFFRLHTPKAPTKRYFFSLGSKFRYSGRTEFQTVEESKRRARVERSFARSPSKRYARRTVGGTTREIIMEERNAIDGYRNAPHNDVDNYRHADGYTRSTSPQKTSRTSNMPNSTSYPNSLTRTSYSDFNHSSVRATLPNDYKHQDVKGRKAWGEQRSSDDEGGFLQHTRSQESQDNGVPTVPPKVMGYMDEEKPTQDEIYELPAYNDTYLPNGGSTHQEGHGLVSIRMKPDTQGRFGFNVKGGADQGMPIIVSRVAPNTPADLCIPRLNEGDQVLFINGRDVSQHTHEQVVMFIRASRETHSGELVLVVRPNVYIGEESTEEPDFQYIPDTHHITTSLPHGSDPLAGSLLLLAESLESGAALAQFEQLYRKKPGLTMNAARMSDNIPKNRYRDISPYDQTRVLIKDGTGDYINANYVNMEIPGSGIVNRYIAAQGPLPNTCADFWQMVWEQQSRLVIMLTTKVERGRVKCHQYWPDLYETMDFGPVQVTCLKEEQTQSFAFREFTLINSGSNEERHIQQMQYLAWPDHGVPDDSRDFLDFVVRVRLNRVGMVEPTVVHCSAGIGRTGVLITMETAMCLIEANQPVYPLDIVRQMRDQRAMLIQTASQYKFVCEAITRVYREKMVKPLEDYQR